MAYVKVYSRINWLNKSESLTTPLGKTNLNKMDKAIDDIDTAMVSVTTQADTLDTTKADKSSLNNMIVNFSYADTTGIMTLTRYDGTIITVDTAIEKMAVNFSYDATSEKLIITLADGTTQEVDLSALITQYEFTTSDTVSLVVGTDGKVTAEIRLGSITKEMLASEVLASVATSEENAKKYAENAAQSETDAAADAKLSQSYAIGTENEVRDGDATDNAKYYKEQAALSATSASTSATTATEQAVSAGTSATNASKSATTAEEQATIAAQEATSASESATSASTSATTATEQATSASTSATNASKSATNAEESEENALGYSNLSKSYAVGTGGVTRENDDTDCAEYYYQQAKQISGALQGALLPMGDTTFANLSTQTKENGYVYNITDGFTTDDTFAEGAGIEFPAGMDVYYFNNKWNLFSGSFRGGVTGVKGDAETDYRTGDVNITLENIGAASADDVTSLKAEVIALKGMVYSGTAAMGIITDDNKLLKTDTGEIIENWWNLN